MDSSLCSNKLAKHEWIYCYYEHTYTYPQSLHPLPMRMIVEISSVPKCNNFLSLHCHPVALMMRLMMLHGPKWKRSNNDDNNKNGNNTIYRYNNNIRFNIQFEYKPTQRITPFVVLGEFECVRVWVSVFAFFAHLSSLRFAPATLATIKTIGLQLKCHS